MAHISNPCEVCDGKLWRRSVLDDPLVERHESLEECIRSLADRLRDPPI